MATSLNLRRIIESEWLRAATIALLTALLGLLLRSRIQPIDAAMLFLLAVVIAASRYRRGPALLTGALGVPLFDFFFIPPYNTLAVLDRTYVFSFAVMFVVALSMTHFTGRIRDQALEALAREREAVRLFELTRELAIVDRVEEQIAIVERHLGAAIQGSARVYLLHSPFGAPRAWPSPDEPDIDTGMAASWAIEHLESAGWGTAHGADIEVLVVPLGTPSQVVGLAVIRPDDLGRDLTAPVLRTVEALAEQAAIAIERTGRIDFPTHGSIRQEAALESGREKRV